MGLSGDIKKDMEYPSIEVKTRYMDEVAHYLRDAYNCGIYSEIFGKFFIQWEYAERI